MPPGPTDVTRYPSLRRGRNSRSSNRPVPPTPTCSPALPGRQIAGAYCSPNTRPPDVVDTAVVGRRRRARRSRCLSPSTCRAVPPDTWGWLPLLTGVAVVDAVDETCGVEAGLKWPNDVLVGSRQAGRHPGRGRRTEHGDRHRAWPQRHDDRRRGARSGATSLPMLGLTEVDRNVWWQPFFDLWHAYRALAARQAAPMTRLIVDYRGHSVTLGQSGARNPARRPGDRRDRARSSTNSAAAYRHRHRRP